MISESNPVFVKIDKYKEILSIVDVINKKVVSVKQLLADLEQLRAKEEEEVRLWEKNMDEITSKLGSMQEELTK
jgi:Sec7-like guanine-nucleotide exchange factor